MSIKYTLNVIRLMLFVIIVCISQIGYAKKACESAEKLFGNYRSSLKLVVNDNVRNEKFVTSLPKLSCKFGDVYNNVNGKFKKVKKPTWPPFSNKDLYGSDVLIQVDTKRKLLEVGNMPFILLSYEKNALNSLTSSIRGYLLNTHAVRPYLEAIIINANTTPIEVTYFDGITGNIVLGVCKKFDSAQ